MVVWGRVSDPSRPSESSAAFGEGAASAVPPSASYLSPSERFARQGGATLADRQRLGWRVESHRRKNNFCDSVPKTIPTAH